MMLRGLPLSVLGTFFPNWKPVFMASPRSTHGVIGTNGKATAPYMLNHILKSPGLYTACWTTNSFERIANSFRPHMTTQRMEHIDSFNLSEGGIMQEDVVRVPIVIGGNEFMQ
jgi:hypothetical protein